MDEQIKKRGTRKTPSDSAIHKRAAEHFGVDLSTVLRARGKKDRPLGTEWKFNSILAAVMIVVEQ